MLKIDFGEERLYDPAEQRCVEVATEAYNKFLLRFPEYDKVDRTIKVNDMRAVYTGWIPDITGHSIIVLYKPFMR